MLWLQRKIEFDLKWAGRRQGIRQGGFIPDLKKGNTEELGMKCLPLARRKKSNSGRTGVPLSAARWGQTFSLLPMKSNHISNEVLLN